MLKPLYLGLRIVKFPISINSPNYMNRTIAIFVFTFWTLQSLSQPLDPPCDQEKSWDGPFKWIPKIHSLGPILVGEAAEFNFWLTNKSKEVVMIKSVSSDHVDVRVSESQKRIKPNEVAYITAYVSPTRPGRLKAEIKVVTDHDGCTYSLKLEANCYGLINAKQKSFKNATMETDKSQKAKDSQKRS